MGCGRSLSDPSGAGGVPKRPAAGASFFPSLNGDRATFHARRTHWHARCGTWPRDRATLHGRCGTLHDDRATLHGRCGTLHNDRATLHGRCGALHNDRGRGYMGRGRVRGLCAWSEYRVYLGGMARICRHRLSARRPKSHNPQPGGARHRADRRRCGRRNAGACPPAACARTREPASDHCPVLKGSQHEYCPEESGRPDRVL